MPGGFIGRDRELAELSVGLQGAIQGRGGVFLIAGEPGIGKTALADCLASDAIERSALVLWGRSWEGAGAPPYFPWSQVIRGLASEYDDETLRSFAGSGAGQIAVLAPDLAARLGGPADHSSTLDSDAGRFYVFEAVERFLRNASSVRPLVLVLDDLFAADYPALLLLRFLAREVRLWRMLLVVTTRDVEQARSPEASDVLVDVVREGQILRLRGLDRNEVGRLVEHVSGTAPVEHKVVAIHEAPPRPTDHIHSVERPGGDPSADSTTGSRYRPCALGSRGRGSRLRSQVGGPGQ